MYTRDGRPLNTAQIRHRCTNTIAHVFVEMQTYTVYVIDTLRAYIGNVYTFMYI